MTLQGKIESLLFVAGEQGLSVTELAVLTQEHEMVIQDVLAQMEEAYTKEEMRGLILVSFARRYQLVTKRQYSELIKQYAISPLATKLSQAALETLAIIAYKQPLTRAQIDAIRGVQSTGALQKLQMRDLIEAKGRENSPGKPILYGTTAYFMNYFGITDLTQLPDISEMEKATPEELQDLFGQRYEKINEQDRKEDEE